MAKVAIGEGPFRPGTGRLPPWLAGRDAEKSFFRARIAAMAAGVPPPSDVILYGPRGNGKTALLVWLDREIASTAGVESVRLTPSEIPTEAKLAERLLPDTWWKSVKPDDISVAGITWRPGGARPVPAARQVLSARTGRKPLVLLLDEAHTLSPEVGQSLLNASQLVGAELPFLLVLAGTPDLRHRLSRMSASFWSRAHQVPVNRLGGEDSAAAILKPFAHEGIAVAPDALERILKHSHGYPFFLQLWGSLVWRRAAGSGSGSVTREHAEAAQTEFAFRQGLYYLDRFNELEDLDLLPAARAVADAFVRQPAVPYGALREAVLPRLGNGAGREDANAALRTLRHLGFIWQSGPVPLWEPGIPSLMRYVREHAPAG